MIVALSGRNRLRGFVEEVRIDGLLGQVRLRIGDQTLTAVVTADALSELKLRRAATTRWRIIKSTEVMIAREEAIADPRSSITAWRRFPSRHPRSGAGLAPRQTVFNLQTPSGPGHRQRWAMICN